MANSEQLGWTLDKVQKEISNSTFLNNNLGGMLRTLKIGAAEAVAMAYPNHNWSYLIDRGGYVLTKVQAQEIRKLYASGIINQRQIAIKYNVSPSQVNLIVKNKVFKEDIKN